MVLSNYWKYQEAISNATYTGTYRYIDTGVKLTSGDAAPVVIDSTSNLWGAVADNKSIKLHTTIVVGSGDTVENEDDYALANDITSEISNVSNSHTVTFENGKLKTTFLFAGSNNTGADLTIKEVGIIKSFHYSNSGGEAAVGSTLFARKLFSEPLTIPTGTSFTVNFEWIEG
jgi:hypothetical protein